jgi:Ca2+-binding RTX toxin-like protein
MMSVPAIERNAGAAGWDWVSGQYDTTALEADLTFTLLGIPLQQVVNRDRYQEVEALSGTKFADHLIGDSIVPVAVGGGGFSGCNALDQDGVDRISGLAAIMPALNTPTSTVTANTATRHCGLTGPFVWGDGNIILGGAGNDTIQGNDANDIIDGNRYLHARISVRTNPADPASEVGTTDLMEGLELTGRNFGPGTAGMTLQQAVFAGLVDPGNLVIVREIFVAPTVPNELDVSVYTGPRAGYTITENPNGSWTVADSRPTGGGGGGAAASDGIDTVWNVERLQFTDGVVSLLQPPVLGLTVPTTLSTPGSLVRAAGTVSAPQNIIVANTGGEPLVVSGATLSGPNAAAFTLTNGCTTVLAGGSCTIGVAFTAAGAAGSRTATLTITHNAGGSPTAVPLNGTVVINSAPTGTPTVNDNTPTEGSALTADPSAIADLDGLSGVFNFQWQQNNLGGAGAFTNVPGATSASFTPLQAQVNRRLRVVVSFVDLHGTTQTINSAQTTSVVGDLFPGLGDDNSGIDTLAGTTGDDVYSGGLSNDSLTTGNGNDIVSGDEGDDAINTGGGDDIIRYSGVNTGFDTVNGGANADTIMAMANGTVIGLSTVTAVETITANGFTGVTIKGTAAANNFNFGAVTLTGITAIDGGDGNDTIVGSSGDDVFIGGVGNDTLTGGSGNDVFRYAAGAGSDRINGFTVGQDKIDLTALGVTAANFSAVVAITNGGGGATRVTIGAVTMLLPAVPLGTVTMSDFILAP